MHKYSYPRYKKNLKVYESGNVFSYSTCIAKVRHHTLYLLVEFFSATTSKHMNYIKQYYTSGNYNHRCINVYSDEFDKIK
jgi:hypothetical protein